MDKRTLKTVRQLWNQLVLEPNSGLLKVIRKELEKNGAEVEFEDLFEFLTDHVGVSTDTSDVRHTSLNRHVCIGKKYLDTNSKGPHLGKKPRRLRFNGAWHEVPSTWRRLPPVFCGLLLQDNVNTFHRVLNFEGNWQSSRRHYFAIRKDLLPKSADPVPIADTGIFVATNLSANNTVNLVETLNEYFGYKDPVEIEHTR